MSDNDEGSDDTLIVDYTDPDEISLQQTVMQLAALRN